MDTGAQHTVRVVVADDHELSRIEIAALLGRSPGVAVVGEATNGAEAIHLTLATHADVLVMDVLMPVLDGVAATRQLYEAHARSAGGSDRAPRPVVLMLTGSRDDGAHGDEYVYEALREGARGFAPRHAGAAELVAAVHDAIDPGRLVRPTETVRLIAALTPDRSARPDIAAARAALTTGDAIVVVGVGHGHDDDRIAHHLGVTVTDVRRRVANVMALLGLSDRAQLVVFAHESGLIVPSPKVSAAW